MAVGGRSLARTAVLNRRVAAAARSIEADVEQELDLATRARPSLPRKSSATFTGKIGILLRFYDQSLCIFVAKSQLPSANRQVKSKCCLNWC